MRGVVTVSTICRRDGAHPAPEVSSLFRADGEFRAWLGWALWSPLLATKPIVAVSTRVP